MNQHYNLLKKIREINKEIESDSFFSPFKYEDYKFNTIKSEALDAFFGMLDKRLNLKILFNKDFSDCLPLLKNVAKTRNTSLSNVFFRPIGISEITKDNIFETNCYDYDIGAKPSAAFSRWTGDINTKVNLYSQIDTEIIDKYSAVTALGKYDRFSCFYIVFDPTMVFNKEVLLNSGVRGVIIDKSGVSFMSSALGNLPTSYIDEDHYFDKYILQMYFANLVSVIDENYGNFKCTFSTVWFDPLTKEKEIFSYEDYLGYISCLKVLTGETRIEDDRNSSSSLSSSEDRAIKEIFKTLNTVSPNFLKESF